MDAGTPGLGSLPGLVGIGAMKAGTSALHRYLDRHPDLAMSRPKELNFFYGTDPTATQADWSPDGNWWRGVAWYRSHFPADGRIGGDVSPGYTSPSYPGVAARMHRLLPRARLLLLVREPLARAVSQFRHHVRDGAEDRPIEEALLDPDSQYVARSRYHERLAPFLEHYAREQVLVVFQEELATDRRATLARVQDHVGVRRHWHPDHERRWHRAGDEAPSVPPRLARRFRERVADDVERLACLVGRLPAAWTAPTRAWQPSR